jgi:hypothetical protein
MAGQDVVYANLAGDLERMARSIVTAMDETGVRRLINAIAIDRSGNVYLLDAGNRRVRAIRGIAK